MYKEKKLRGVPRQNYNNIFVTPDTPFHGHISDLRYWNKSLGTHAIYNLISAGPNLDNIKQQASTNATIPDISQPNGFQELINLKFHF